MSQNKNAKAPSNFCQKAKRASKKHALHYLRKADKLLGRSPCANALAPCPVTYLGMTCNAGTMLMENSAPETISVRSRWIT